MEKIELLERHFNTFIELQNSRDFFVGMADYFDLMETIPQFKNVTSDILTEGNTLQTKLESLGQSVVMELDKIKQQIDHYVSSEQIKDHVLLKEIQEYENWKNGLIHGSQPLPKALHLCLTDIVERLHSLPGHPSFVAQFVVLIENNGKPIVQRLKPFNQYREYSDLEQEIQSKLQTSLWGQLGQILQLYEVIKHGRREYKELVEINKTSHPPGLTWKLMNWGILVQEWAAIEDGEDIRDIYFFKVEKIRPWVKRLHNYVISQITLNSYPSGAEGVEGISSVSVEQTKIKTIKLLSEDLLLEINGGKKIISFKARKNKGENEETKFFKMIHHFWDFRDEISKSGKKIRQGQWVTLENLAKGAGSTQGATSKNIGRLREKFKTEGVTIDLLPSNSGRYKLVIYFG